MMINPTRVSRLVFLLALSSAVSAQEWRFYGGDAGGTRFSPLRQINRQNVGSLKRAWTYHMGEADRVGNGTDRHRVAPFESTPLVIDDTLYFSTPSNRVIALDLSISSSTGVLPTGRARQEMTAAFCTVLSTGA